MDLVLALAAGALIGLSLGALGGGGSILAVPVLVYLLGQSPSQGTTGSLVIVGVTSLIGAATAYRSGGVLLGRGVAFGAVAIGGAAVGSAGATRVRPSVLMASFAALMLVVAIAMVVRLVRERDQTAGPVSGRSEPVITFRPAFRCRCSLALKVLTTATVVGLLTGFLGVGGGFLVVPALLLVLSTPMRYAVGTSLVVITITSAAALVVRAGSDAHPNWTLVAALTAASATAAVAGARLAAHVDTRWLSRAFTGLVLVVAVYTATQAVPNLV